MYDTQDFIKPLKQDLSKKEIFLKASAPSNIALVKYWGKYGEQYPMNPSISFTLNKSKTLTNAFLEPTDELSKIPIFKFYLDNRHQPDFEPKIADFFKKIQSYVPFISLFKWKFYSQNTFPHSSGIASSASGFATLAKLIMQLEKRLFPEINEDYFLAKTSFLARLGSGSAARSIQHPVMFWGKHPDIALSSDLYAIQPGFKLHPVFKSFQDTIILVEKGQKQVSSSAGHALMENHAYKVIRKQQAFERSLQMCKVLKTGDLQSFINLVEAEALSLHALMMTSDPNYILMEPDTLRIIKTIRRYREQQNVPVCFTLDAGANVHILYPENIKQKLKNDLLSKLEFEQIEDFIL